jgi:hypothetical protein
LKLRARPAAREAYPNDPQLRARQLHHLQQAGLPTPLQ